VAEITVVLAATPAAPIGRSMRLEVAWTCRQVWSTLLQTQQLEQSEAGHEAEVTATAAVALQSWRGAIAAEATAVVLSLLQGALVNLAAEERNCAH